MLCEKCMIKEICTKRACFICDYGVCQYCGIHNPYHENPNTEPCKDFIDKEKFTEFNNH